MKIYLCWLVKREDFRLLVGAFQSKKAAGKWLINERNPTSSQKEIQEIDWSSLNNHDSKEI